MPRTPSTVVICWSESAARTAGRHRRPGRLLVQQLRQPEHGDRNDAVQLPTYAQYQGIKPDLPATEAGVDPAFRYFPTTNPSVVPEKPAPARPSPGMANIYYAVPPGPDRNTYWQGPERPARGEPAAADGQ